MEDNPPRHIVSIGNHTGGIFHSKCVFVVLTDFTKRKTMILCSLMINTNVIGSP